MRFGAVERAVALSAALMLLACSRQRPVSTPAALPAAPVVVAEPAPRRKPAPPPQRAPVVDPVIESASAKFIELLRARHMPAVFGLRARDPYKEIQGPDEIWVTHIQHELLYKSLLIDGPVAVLTLAEDGSMLRYVAPDLLFHDPDVDVTPVVSAAEVSARHGCPNRGREHFTGRPELYLRIDCDEAPDPACRYTLVYRLDTHRDGRDSTSSVQRVIDARTNAKLFEIDTEPTW